MRSKLSADEDLLSQENTHLSFRSNGNSSNQIKLEIKVKTKLEAVTKSDSVNEAPGTPAKIFYWHYCWPAVNKHPVICATYHLLALLIVKY